MKTTYVLKLKLLSVLFFIFSSNLLLAQVGIGTTTPDDSAALDIDTSDAGFLMPRVALTSTTDTATISGTEATGLLVYNTATVSDVTPGFYYWDGSKWVNDLSGAGISSTEDDWTILGNTGTDDTVNYIGTTDSEDLVFKADGNEYMRLSWDTGYFGINTTAAQEYLDVNGDIDFGGGSADWDSQGENLHIRARSDDWFVAATNASNQTESSFYISTGQNPDVAQFRIENNGFVNIGGDNEFEARDMLHVTNDSQTETTAIRIDNTNKDNSIFHTAFELWDGSTEPTGMKAFFRHNNKDNILEIGHTKDDGTVYLYSGDSSGSNSAITMTLDDASHVGIGTTTPDDSAALDIDLSDAGFLMPRVTLTGTTDTATVSGSEATGLLVYNTATVSDVTPGFYYWDGSKWVAIGSGSGGSSSDDWTTTGNAGTTPASNFIGTTDTQDLVFKTDDDEQMRIMANGYVGINTTSADEYLDVNGDIDMGGGSANYDADGENIKFRARSDTWYVSARNASSSSSSSFYISTSQDWRFAPFLITNDGKVNIGADDGAEPDDMLHVTNDQDDTTTIRIDNTNSGGSNAHTSLELWDGSSSTGEMAFFRYNNSTETLELGSARGNGQVDFYTGDGGSSSGSSDISMTLENDGHVTIQSVMNLNPGSAPSSPSKGDVYYDSSDDKVKVYTGSGWENLN